MASKRPLKLSLGPCYSDALKCYLTAALSDKSLAAVPIEALGIPVVKFPTACVETGVLTSAISICRFLSPISSATSEKWLEIEQDSLKPHFHDLSTPALAPTLEQLTQAINTNELSTISNPDSAPNLETICLVSTFLASFDSSTQNQTFLESKYPTIDTFISTFIESNLKKVEFAVTKAKSQISKQFPGCLVNSEALQTSGNPVVKELNKIFNKTTIETFPFLSNSFYESLEEGKPQKSSSKSPQTSTPELQFSGSLKIFGLLKSLKTKDTKSSELSKVYDKVCVNPRKIAEILVSRLERDELLMIKVVHKFEVTGPGFINIHLRESYGNNFISNILKRNRINPLSLQKNNPQISETSEISKNNVENVGNVKFDFLNTSERQSLKIGIDMSSPNVAKEMHVGHLRSTILGEVLSRVLAYRGHTVSKINHLGDWGTAFGMLLQYIEEHDISIDTNTTTLTQLNEIYKSSKNKFDQDAEFKTRSRKKVVKLQRGDVQETETWKKLIQISESGFSQVYERLDVTFPDGNCGESFYQSRIPDTIKQLTAKKLVEEYEGAKIITTDIQKVPLFIQKSDGGFGYDTTDLTAINYRFNTLKLNKMLYIVDTGQANHFYSVFQVANKMNWIPKQASQTSSSSSNSLTLRPGPEFVGFGLVCGKDGKRFRSRSGETVSLKSLLDEGKSRIKAELERRIENKETNLTLEEVDGVSSKLGYSAIKYFDIKNSREKDYIFDFDQILQPTGNTGVYIIYTYARLCSIQRKLTSTLNLSVDDILQRKSVGGVGSVGGLCLSKERRKEWDIVRELLKYGDVLESVEESLCPHVLCGFVYELCVAVSKFYTEHQLIVNTPHKQGEKQLDPTYGEDWVCLLHCAKIVIGECAPLLGIQLVDKV